MIDITYKNVIELLETRRKQTIADLKNNRTESLMSFRKELDQAIKWLTIAESFSLDPNSRIIIFPDPETQTPSSEYRIVEDHESDNKQYWTELKINTKEIRPSPGDLLILK
jgi:hypothetical protein